MCGLFGFVCFSGAPQDYLLPAREALNTLTHRGPDQHSDALAGNVYLGHRRLSILDLSEAGRQPMASSDEAVAIAVNGEIYNHTQLRSQLGLSHFRSRSDSEVVLHGYQKWGLEGLLERMDGMYALAIHDRAKSKLILARDRVGIKPLYYARIGAWFAWASELKALERFLYAEALEYDGTALYDFLAYRYIPTPKTPYRQIHKLPAARSLQLNTQTGHLDLRCYWTLQPQSLNRPKDEIAAELREKITNSVRTQIMADVPLGTFLSGGIDSTIVTNHASSMLPHMHSFSIGFDQASHDETRFAAIAAEAFGTEHHVKTLDKSHSHGILDLMRRLCDEPFGDYSALAAWHLSGLARQHVTVALSGDGGDELFGGYKWYDRIPSILRRRGPFAGFAERLSLPYHKRAPSYARRVANAIAVRAGMSMQEIYIVLMNGEPQLTRRQFREILEIPTDYDDYWLIRQHYDARHGPRKSLQVLDFHTYLVDDILAKVDRSSMHFGLECRVPLLSRELVELAFSLPEDFIYMGGQLKGGLKYAYRDILPPEILKRGKKGFGIPVRAWDVLSDESFEVAVLRDYLRVRRRYPVVETGTLEPVS
jgi:asparagine synthase (glutamine-hydrolysing)